MASLPSGTVTFLFTDIEGSTTRWEHQPEAMRVALARHDAIMRAAIAEHGGHVVKTMGDAFHAVFVRAPDAVAAALDAQRRLQAEPWSEIGPIKVRMAVHTGAAEERDGDYYGPPLNRAARLMSAGHGGQSLLSQSTYELVRDTPPEGVAFVDLGEHRLKDLIRPERVFQLAGTGVPSDFPPLASLDARPHNLPLQTTPLLGREHEVEAVRSLLHRDGVRLVTLTGPGGTGKTRLSLQVAADLVDQLADGAFFVELAPITDPNLVPSTIGQVLGVGEVAGRPPLDVLVDYLRDRRLLLVLDNFEQVLAAATVPDALLRACPGLRILVSSRAALQLRGEHEYPVPPLALPDMARPVTPEALSQYGAVALFVERATAIKPDFAVTNANAQAVAEICVRLDGLPLAIELAAARIRLLSPGAMLPRLGHGLSLLTGGRRDLPARQQTLRGAIAWSYDLLSEAERRLFRQLGVFVGGFTLEAAEGICHGAALESTGQAPEIDVLGGIGSLVDHSLVRPDETLDGEPRFRMLETIREYALDQLLAAGEEERLRRHHRDWFGGFVERQTARLSGPGQAEAFERLEAEHDNLRAVLDWCETEPGGWEVAARLAGELNWFWGLRGYQREARERLERLLTLATRRTEGRARALSAAGWCTERAGEYERAAALFEESIAIWRDLGDKRGTAIALALFGRLEQSRGNYDRAWTLLEESRGLFREIGGESGQDAPLAVFLAQVAKNRGDYERAISLFEECLTLARERGDAHATSSVLRSLGELRQLRGDYGRSATYLRESLILIRELDDRPCAVSTLDSLAVLATARGEPARALRLFAAAEIARQVAAHALPPADRGRLAQAVDAARAQLGPAAIDAACAEGRELSLDQAIAYALETPALT